MAKVIPFKINIELDRSLFAEPYSEKLAYYRTAQETYWDEVIFDDAKITISGDRHRAPKSDVFLRAGSRHYADVVKALLFAFYSRGAFEVKSIVLTWDEADEKREIKLDTKYQSFNRKSVDRAYLQFDPVALFADYNISKYAMEALMYLAKAEAHPYHSFEYAWRGFNVLMHAMASPESPTDDKRLRDIRRDLEDSSECYSCSMQYAESVTDDSFSSLNGVKMLQNYFDTEGKCKGAPDCFRSFEDARVCRFLREKVECKHKEFVRLGVYNDVVTILDERIGRDAVRNTDVTRLMVLKYAYFRRNKLFHGEKRPSYFITGTEDERELETIIEPLYRIIVDIVSNRLVDATG